mmetsp:Transcript_46111/g.96835  ORF Transcript_46111/g.96835 Transcript_46111/m.96835 type:complete len:201 (+) Transcript_46111:1248-1850(+)
MLLQRLRRILQIVHEDIFHPDRHVPQIQLDEPHRNLQRREGRFQRILDRRAGRDARVFPQLFEDAAQQFAADLVAPSGDRGARQRRGGIDVASSDFPQFGASVARVLLFGSDASDAVVVETEGEAGEEDGEEDLGYFFGPGFAHRWGEDGAHQGHVFVVIRFRRRSVASTADIVVRIEEAVFAFHCERLTAFGSAEWWRH